MSISKPRLETVLADLHELRSKLEVGFGPETAAPGWKGSTKSTGQCAAVATVVHDIAGGQLLSAAVDGKSHWFNRLKIGDSEIDVDLTADQFGQPPVLVGAAGTLYPKSRVRLEEELNDETIRRACLLAARSNIRLTRGGRRLLSERSTRTIP